MSYEILSYEMLANNHEIIRFRLKGTFQSADMQELQNMSRTLIDMGVKPRILIMAEDFAGWAGEGEWDGDMGFFLNYSDDIVKMAIVCEECWEKQIAMFTGKGLRKTEIEFFPVDAQQQAEDWLRA